MLMSRSVQAAFSDDCTAKLKQAIGSSFIGVTGKTAHWSRL